MKTVQRALVTVATAVLLTAGAAALAAPAHADVHANVLGLIGADSNGVIDLTGPGGVTLVELPNALEPVV
ncbi:hypothetical protein [Streptomyces sp. NPDC053079]|uniref:hypothetical protein n=1 Tax=Streptomyces sp. NPDC053079 TaxID=3365697 RepID=UPI0037D05829